MTERRVADSGGGLVLGEGDRLIGRSQALRRVLEQVELVARTDANVLVLGESGTGKELIARAIHASSPRASKPLVRVNCASIPRELFESEFFGHVRGAFTGALRDRAGRFQHAEGGTLFLDEIGEVPLEHQSKLLRVLQEGTYERVGEERTRRADVRIVAATNRDLREEVASGRFRQDLYFRLSVFPVEIPPLRERVEDIPLLADFFVEQMAKRVGHAVPPLKRRHVIELQRHAWPGNVRELQNVIERAVILAHGEEVRLEGVLEVQPVEDATRSRPSSGGSASAWLPEGRIVTEREWVAMQRENIRRALERTEGRIFGAGGAAELLGVKPTTLRSRIGVLFAEGDEPAGVTRGVRGSSEGRGGRDGGAS